MGFLQIIALLAILWESGIIQLFILVCICIFIWEKFRVILLLLLGILLIFYFWLLYSKTKNKNVTPKTPEELERIKNLEKVREWSRRNKC